MQSDKVGAKRLRVIGPDNAGCRCLKKEGYNGVKKTLGIYGV